MPSMGTDLVEVTVETHLGARHVFPDMPRDMLKNIIEKSGWTQIGRVVLVNISGAVLTLESRTVRCISFDGKVQWGDAPQLVPPVPQLPDPG